MWWSSVQVRPLRPKNIKRGRSSAVVKGLCRLLAHRPWPMKGFEFADLLLVSVIALAPFGVRVQIVAECNAIDVALFYWAHRLRSCFIIVFRHHIRSAFRQAPIKSASTGCKPLDFVFLLYRLRLLRTPRSCSG